MLRSLGSTIFDYPLRFCVIGRSRSIVRAEDDLRQAVFVTVVGTRLSVSRLEVLEAIADNFGLDSGALSIHPSALEDFLLPGETMTEMVINGGLPVRASGIALLVKSWTRQAHAVESSIPYILLLMIDRTCLHSVLRLSPSIPSHFPTFWTTLLLSWWCPRLALGRWRQSF